MSLLVMEGSCGGEFFEEVDDPNETEYSDSLFRCTTCERMIIAKIDHTHREEKES